MFDAFENFSNEWFECIEPYTKTEWMFGKPIDLFDWELDCEEIRLNQVRPNKLTDIYRKFCFIIYGFLIQINVLLMNLNIFLITMRTYLFS